MKTKTFFNAFATFLVVLLAFIMCFSLFTIDNAIANADASQDSSASDTEEEIVFDYNTVFQIYYENTKNRYGDNFVDLETFRSNYYTSGLTISEYCESYFNPVDNGISLLSGDKPVANYILSPAKYEKTPSSVFKRKPVYTEYLYSYLNVGDIVYESEASVGHIAVIVDTQHDSDYGKYCQTIESVPTAGVTYGFLDDDRIVATGVRILRAKGFTANKKSNLIYFLEKQLRRDYNYNFTQQKSDINSDNWYCSELAWAAYNYVGIDIGQINGVPVGGDGNASCLPYTIYISDNTYIVSIQTNKFLKASIAGKSGTTWKIKITNNTSQPVTVEYNEKMCFKDDAKDWDLDKLKDIKSFELPRYSSKTVDISENWFATDIAISCSDGTTRYITYGDQLHAINTTFNIKYVMKKV